MSSVLLEPVCHVCGIPVDAGFFDSSSIVAAPTATERERVLASFTLHTNYCGTLLYFAQFTDAYAANPVAVETPGLEWQIRVNGSPRDPYLTFNRLINPWGLSGFPIHLRLEEGCVLEFVVRFAGAGSGSTAAANLPPITKVGGRLLGRYWYNSMFGNTRR